MNLIHLWKPENSTKKIDDFFTEIYIETREYYWNGDDDNCFIKSEPIDFTFECKVPNKGILVSPHCYIPHPGDFHPCPVRETDTTIDFECTYKKSRDGRCHATLKHRESITNKSVQQGRGYFHLVVIDMEYKSHRFVCDRRFAVFAQRHSFMAFSNPKITEDHKQRGRPRTCAPMNESTSLRTLKPLAPAILRYTPQTIEYFEKYGKTDRDVFWSQFELK